MILSTYFAVESFFDLFIDLKNLKHDERKI